MLDSIYRITLRLPKNLISGNFVINEHCYERHFLTLPKSVNLSGLSILLHGVISLRDTIPCDK